MLGLILAAGSVGRDVSSGVLALVLTRPLVRTTYLLAKWTAVSTAVAALACATLAVQTILLRSRGVDISGGVRWRANAFPFTPLPSGRPWLAWAARSRMA